MTGEELDERIKRILDWQGMAVIDAVVSEATYGKRVVIDKEFVEKWKKIADRDTRELIRDCIEAVYPDNVPPLYKKVTNDEYREVHKLVQANTKELLG